MLYRIEETLKKTCVFIRINPDEKKINFFNAINKILKHINKSTKELTKELTKKAN